MADHLNSVHLELPRREKFRQARARLLDSCGNQTRMGAIQLREPEEDGADDSHTMLQNLAGELPDDWDYGLMDQEAIYPLKVGLNTIGRMPDNEVVIEDPYVSRRHCAIVVHAGNGFELHDIASKNGTFLNGNKLTGPTPLNSGDEIRMCDKQLIFVTRPGLAQGPARAPTISQ
jgi:hypothetical protein